MIKGDIILITFPFTDLSSSKLRRAIVLVKSKLDVTVAFISSNIGLHEDTDVVLFPNNENGLKKDSLIRTSKIATLDNSLSKGILGNINNEQIKKLNDSLRVLFNL